MSFYANKEEETLFKSHLETLCKNHREKELELIKPDGKSIDQMRQIILDYVKEKQRIIYGGYAMDILLKEKTDGKVFVYDELCKPDVEFYTDDLQSDVMELCILLREKGGFIGVMSEEGVHPSTWKIKACLNTAICDVTYFPTQLYSVIPTIKSRKGYLCAHPWHMMIDTYTVYSKPLINYFRLTKTYSRAQLLLQSFPLDYPESRNCRGNNKNRHSHKPQLVVVDKVSEWIKSSSNSSLLLTGSTAHDAFMKVSGLETRMHWDTFMVVASTNYTEDVKALCKLLEDSQKSQVTIKWYAPFQDYLLEKADLIIDGKTVVRIQKEDGGCVPYVIIDKRKYTSTQYTIRYLMLERLRLKTLVHMKPDKVSNMEHRTSCISAMIVNMVDAKKKYYAEHKDQTIFTRENNPFQEFILECSAQSKIVTPLYASKVLMNQRKRQGKALRLRYIPSSKKGIRKPFKKVKFDQSLGQLVGISTGSAGSVVPPTKKQT